MQKGRQVAQQAQARLPESYVSALQILGLAEAFSGSARAGLEHCREAVTKAEAIKDERLLAEARLALAQSKAINGDWQGALTLASQAQESFGRLSRLESAWRAWLVIARSSGSLKQTAQARDAALKASETMDRLQQRWGAESYNRYLTRPDIKSQQAQLRELLSQ